MLVILTAVGPDNRGLADPIVHHVTAAGANIAELQMYDHDRERLFAMLMRMDWPVDLVSVVELRARMQVIGRDKRLSIRVWSPEEHSTPPRVALAVTHRTQPARAVLESMRTGQLAARAVVMLGNQPTCRDLASERRLAPDRWCRWRARQ